MKAVFYRSSSAELNSLFNAAFHNPKNPMWNRSFMGKHALARKLRGQAKRAVPFEPALTRSQLAGHA